MGLWLNRHNNNDNDDDDDDDDDDDNNNNNKKKKNTVMSLLVFPWMGFKKLIKRTKFAKILKLKTPLRSKSIKLYYITKIKILQCRKYETADLPYQAPTYDINPSL